MTLVRAGRVITPARVLENVYVQVEDGVIRGVGRRGELASTVAEAEIDAGALTVVPGFVDVHTHGIAGVQAIDGTRVAMHRMAETYARHGVTAFLAGVFGTREQIEAGLDAAVAWQLEQSQHGSEAHARALGAAMLGIYLEGPFLSPDWPGAFAPGTILDPDATVLRDHVTRARGTLRLLTLAPERPGAAELVALAADHGIVCAIGHSGATFEEAAVAAEHGVRHITHTFNAMPQLHHRRPGVLGAALTDERFTVEIIADGIHVHPALVRLLAKAKGPNAVVLVTDSIAAAGLPEGDYQFRDVAVRLEGGAARLSDGTLAGSTLTMERGVANLVAFGAASLPEAISMASTNPARLLGLASQKGRIEAGYDADLVALTPDLEVAWTMVAGDVVHRGAA